jgi:type IV pilus assembly protein PilQ
MQPNFRLAAFAFSMVTILSGTAVAENAITQVQVRQDGESALVKIEMRDPVKAAPGNWSIVEPPRLVFDFPDTQNLTGKTNQKIDAGDLKSLNLVQAESLTRLVLNLHRTAAFTTEVEGNAIFVRLTGRGDNADRSPSSRVPSASSSAIAAKTAASPVMDGVIREILFRRGEDGQGIVSLSLSDGTLPMDIQRTPAGLVIQLSDVDIPDRLQNRRDTVDFATPVTHVTAQRTRTGARIDVQAKGHWFHQAHIANNMLTIEVKPIPIEDTNKLIQRGQQGQKISINFYEAEATMILRTLAEISGKNVMVDPSLAGKKVSVSLENIPYDEALDIVLAQVNASMRIRNDVVVFADRATLLQRDQDRADDLARASDTAPLVSETFQLSFIKVADATKLILQAMDNESGPRQDRSQQDRPQPVVQTAGGASVPSVQPAVVGKGLLSARGNVSQHAETNKLFIRDTSDRIEAIREIIRGIDVPAKQVMIEARLVAAETGFSRHLGMRLGVNDLSNTIAGQGIGQQLVGGTFAVAGRTTADLNTATGQNSSSRVAPTVPFLGPSIDLPNESAKNKFAISVFNKGLTRFINLELQAGEDEKKVKNISSPRIVTANNKEALILKGTQVAYIGYSTDAGRSVTFQDATLSLKVKPQIAPNGTIILKLEVTNDELGPTASNGQPTILKSKISTEVTVENGGTTVLGGVLKETYTGSEERIPFLSDIPIVGKYFKSTSKVGGTEELLVFITPRVLDESISQAVAR